MCCSSASGANWTATRPSGSSPWGFTRRARSWNWRTARPPWSWRPATRGTRSRPPPGRRSPSWPIPTGVRCRARGSWTWPASRPVPSSVHWSRGTGCASWAGVIRNGPDGRTPCTPLVARPLAPARPPPNRLPRRRPPPVAVLRLRRPTPGPLRTRRCPADAAVGGVVAGRDRTLAPPVARPGRAVPAGRHPGGRCLAPRALDRLAVVGPAAPPLHDPARDRRGGGRLRPRPLDPLPERPSHAGSDGPRVRGRRRAEPEARHLPRGRHLRGGALPADRVRVAGPGAPRRARPGDRGHPDGRPRFRRGVRPGAPLRADRPVRPRRVPHADADRGLLRAVVLAPRAGRCGRGPHRLRHRRRHPSGLTLEQGRAVLSPRLPPLLLLRRVHHRPPLGLRELVPGLQFGEDACRPVEDGRRHPSQAGDLNAVTPLGAPRSDLVQEDHLVFELAHLHVVVPEVW